MPEDHLDEAIGGWCPSCRTAFRPGFEECPDCEVELVDELPPLPPRRRLDAEPGEAVEYGLGDWRDDQRDGLTLLLQVSEVPFAWEGTVLIVPPSAEAEVDALVDEIDGGADLSIPEEPEPLPPVPAGPPVPAPLAGRWRRLGGYVIDSLLGFAVFFVAIQSVDPFNGASLVVVVVTTWCLTIGNTVVGVARWGRSLGKLLTGTKVVMAEDRALPGWGRSLRRWSITGLVGVVEGVAPRNVVVGLVVPVWAIAVHAPILWPARRGLHDRLAGTIVIVDR